MYARLLQKMWLHFQFSIFSINLKKITKSCLVGLTCISNSGPEFLMVSDATSTTLRHPWGLIQKSITPFRISAGAKPSVLLHVDLSQQEQCHGFGAGQHANKLTNNFEWSTTFIIIPFCLIYSASCTGSFDGAICQCCINYSCSTKIFPRTIGLLNISFRNSSQCIFFCIEIRYFYCIYCDESRNILLPRRFGEILIRIFWYVEWVNMEVV